jgi:hypothetical protein
VTGIDTSVWLLAGITDHGTCGQPLSIHPSGRDRRFYLCAACDDLHPTGPAENLVAATVRERDWMLAQHRGNPDAWPTAWSQPTGADVRRHVDRLVDRVLLADASIEVRWRPAAVLPPECPYLGDWTSPVPDLTLRRAPITDAPSRSHRMKGEP